MVEIPLSKCSFKMPDILSDFIKLRIFQQIFIKVPIIRFHENQSIGSRGDIYGQTDEQTWRR
jgi:hypothetical protein